MGVADMTSTCGVSPLAESAARCCHAEAVLLVRNDRAQPVKGHALLDERVRADHDLRRAGFDCGERGPLLRRGHRAGEQGAGNAQPAQQGGERFRVLDGEDLGRRHESGLPAVLRGQRAQRRRHDRLARADVALHQPVHRPAGGAVRRDLPDRAALRARGGERQRVQIGVQPALREKDAGIGAAALLELPAGRSAAGTAPRTPCGGAPRQPRPLSVGGGWRPARRPRPAGGIWRAAPRAAGRASRPARRRARLRSRAPGRAGSAPRSADRPAQCGLGGPRPARPFRTGAK